MFQQDLGCVSLSDLQRYQQIVIDLLRVKGPCKFAELYVSTHPLMDEEGLYDIPLQVALHVLVDEGRVQGKSPYDEECDDNMLYSV